MHCLYCEIHNVKTELAETAATCHICRNYQHCPTDATTMQKLECRQRHREFMKKGALYQ